MISSTDLKLKLQELINNKKFTEAISLMEQNFPIADRPAGIFNLLGFSKLSENKTTENLLSAISDFKSAYEKDGDGKIGLESLANLINSIIELYDLDKSLVDFDEVIDLYSKLKNNNFLEDYQLNNSMKRLYTRLNDSKRIIVHLEKMVNNKDSRLRDYCSINYFRMFNNDCSQEDFFYHLKNFNEKVPKYNNDNLLSFPKIKNEKIKIGFLSADIRNSHSVTFFLKSILKDYNKNKFEIYLILNQNFTDDTTKVFSNLVYKTINIHNLDDIIAINTIRKYNLNLVFDLMGLTSESKVEIIKNRIAHNQVSWLGYCNTTGLDNMDYLITDRNLIKKEEEKYYSEKIIYLPNIWNCHSGINYLRKKINSPTSSNNHITFGCFNNFMKINDNVIQTWSKILKLSKNSKLLLKSSMEKDNNRRIKKKFAEYGISDSIIFHEHDKNFQDHLKLYEKVDVALDTFPYNGVTTSFEALFMGVPVLTMAGYNFNSRCGASINKNLKLDYLISKDQEDYINKAVELSNDIKKLNDLRNFIFENVIDSSLFDNVSFSKSFFNMVEEINHS